jgi:hypothetical protein
MQQQNGLYKQATTGCMCSLHAPSNTPHCLYHISSGSNTNCAIPMSAATFATRAALSHTTWTQHAPAASQAPARAEAGLSTRSKAAQLRAMHPQQERCPSRQGQQHQASSPLPSSLVDQVLPARHLVPACLPACRQPPCLALLAHSTHPALEAQRGDHHNQTGYETEAEQCNRSSTSAMMHGPWPCLLKPLHTPGLLPPASCGRCGAASRPMADP